MMCPASFIAAILFIILIKNTQLSQIGMGLTVINSLTIVVDNPPNDQYNYQLLRAILADVKLY